MPRRDPAPPGCSLLIRNLSRSTRPDDLRYTAEKYGRLRDVYIPRDYHTGEPRGIGFLEYSDPRDAEDAKDALDRAIIHGREQGRKQPDDYRAGRRSGNSDYGGGGGSGRRRSNSRSPRRRSYTPTRHKRSHSRSPSRGRSRTPKRRSSRRSMTRSRSHTPTSRSPSPHAEPVQQALSERE